MSSENLTAIYQQIKSCLQETLKDIDSHLEFLAEPVPLLLLEEGKDVAGFAVMNGSPQQTYEAVYEQFKKLYAERHKNWASRYLSFVLCRTTESSVDDSFYSELENDVYFCKKYVIRVGLDKTAFQQELQRLPFIPLKPDSVTALKRPLSAQTLLRECGVDAKLAYYLVKVKERSAERIIDDYLENVYAKNPFQRPKELFQPLQEIEEPLRKTARLQSLIIKNFRAYKGQKFDLDADIIILYGPNGLGKTSFYDALEFACTGGIARLTGHIDKIAPHLDSKSSESYVIVEIRKEDKTEIIKRTVDDYSYAQLDNCRIGRKDLLFNLTGLVWEDTAARVENLEKLFRATHMFGQAYQELLSDYQKNSELSEEIVARILAFEDYVGAGKKTRQVIELLEKKKEELSSKRNVFNKQLEDNKSQRDLLAKTVQAVATPEAIKMLAQDIANKVKQTIDINLPIISQVDKNEIRNWRATLSGEIELIQERLNKITILEHSHKQVTMNRTELEQKKKVLQQTTVEIDTATKRIAENQKNQETILTTIYKLAAENNKLSEKHFLDTWHLQAIKKHSYLSEKKTVLLRKLKELSLSPEVNPDKLKEDEAKLLWVKDNLSQWKTYNEHIKNKRAELSNCQKERNEKEKELNACKPLLNKNQQELLIIGNKIKTIREGESRLLAILDDIEGFVKDSICPICGTDHNTKEVLLQRIYKQKQKRPYENEEIINTYQQKQKEVDKLKQKVVILENTVKNAQEEEKEISDGLRELEKVISEFQERVKKFGLEINEALSERINNRLDQIKVLEEYAVNCRESDNIESEAKAKRLLFSIDVKELEKTLHNTRQQLSELQERMEGQERQKKTIEQLLSLTSDRLRTLKENRATTNKDIDNLMRSIFEYEGDLAKLNIKANAGIEVIQSKKANLQIQSKKINAMNDEIIRLETAIDTAQSTARLAELDSEIAKTQIKVKGQDEKIKEIEYAIHYFDKIGDTLAEQKNNSISEYTNNFGPLASIIQRRLRPVYGFGPVVLTSKAGKIYVQVSRRSETLKPIDYFSDSQNQILMLSLFLSAGMTQTWSSFAPILIDDPITHFDDINAYAFVELIRGLVDDSKGDRQFIISTCDENLWELFRQRFSCLNVKAIMYKFIAIGDEGPIIKRIN